MFAGAALIVCIGLCPAQDPLFTEVDPVHDPGQGAGYPFPALKDMRSAWGDIDGDGDFDVIVMGEGPSGPVTKLYRKVDRLESPFAFEEVPTTLPQLRSGALAWGDLDNDGDLDLAMSGWLTPTPPDLDPVDFASLRFRIYLNDGPGVAGAWQFTDYALGPAFPPFFGGGLSWGDVDNDGDLDLFASGRISNGASQPRSITFARLYENIRGNLTHLSSQRFLSFSGSEADRLYALGDPGGHDTIEAPQETDVHETRRVIWADVNKDSLPDLVLQSQPAMGFYFVQEIWINRGAGNAARFERLGDTATATMDYPGEDSVHPDAFPWRQSEKVDYYNDRIGGGVGDWNGDGWTDLAFIGKNNHHPTHRVVWYRDPDGIAPGPAVIPGFSTRLYSDSDDQIAVQISADILNTGSQQWLGSVFDTSFIPFFRVLSGGGDSLINAAVAHLALTARFGGVLDAVDVDRDGRLDILHSGYDGLLSGPNGELEAETKFYRGTGVPNTRPAPPPAASLFAEATPFGVHFRWDAGADSQTPPAALRYAVKLRNAAGTYYIRPGATDAGQRLTPGLHGTLQTTHYHFDADNAGRGRTLPDGTYHWSVQSVDSAGAGSVFAAEQTFVLSAGQQTDNEETGLPYRDMAVDTGDVDNDGDLDVILAGGSNAVSWPHGDSTVLSRYLGANGFDGTSSTLPPLLQGAVRWGDVDGDGDLDLAMSGRSFGQPVTRVYRNRAGTLEAPQLLTGVEASALDWGDADNDGDLDLLVTGYAGGKPLTLLYRNGGAPGVLPAVPAGTLSSVGTNLPNYGAGAVAWGDYDHDGDLDVLLCGDQTDYSAPPPPVIAPPYHMRPPNTSYMAGPGGGPPATPRTRIYRNDGVSHAGNWIFTEVDTALPPVMSSFYLSGGLNITARAEWCDLSGDGVPDLVLGGVFSSEANPGYGQPAAKAFRNDGPDPNLLGGWLMLPGRELLTGGLNRALQTLTCGDWDNDGLPDVLLSGRINDPGMVPVQVVHNENFAFTRHTFLRPLDEGQPRFVAGPAAFGHFTNDANLDGIVSGMWGITSTVNNSTEGVNVGRSSLIGQLDYSDTFTGTDYGGRPARFLDLGLQPAAYAIENTYGHPALSYQFENFDDFGFFFGADRAAAEDDDGPAWEEDPEYSANLIAGGYPLAAAPNASGAGSSTGMTQAFSPRFSFSVPYGFREDYMVQMDVLQLNGGVQISSGRSIGFTSVTSLTVIFKGDGSGGAALFNGFTETPIPGFSSGISGSLTAGQWRNFAVRFNRPAHQIEIYVDQVSLRRIDLQTFAGGLYANYSNDMITVGGWSDPSHGIWTDNFQVGSANPVSTATWGTSGSLFVNPRPPVNAPPSVPGGLAATVSGSGSEITFSWQAATDDRTPAAAISYNLHVVRVDGQPGGMPGMADLTTGKRRVCRTGNVGHHLTWTLRNLPAGAYRWSVQALDAALATSAFATAAQIVTAGVPTVPVLTPLPPLHQWVVSQPVVSAVDFRGLAAKRNARLAVGRRGQILLSRRRGPFTPVESAVFTDLQDALIDSAGAVVVGDGGVIRTSSDGIIWTESPGGTTAALRAIAASPNDTVAGGEAGILRSTDRRAWSPVTLPAGTAIHDIAWGMGRYVAVGGRANAKVILTSTDGLTWTETTPPGLAAGKLTGVATDGAAKFIAVGGSTASGGGLTYHADLLTSADGQAWTSEMSTTDDPMSCIIHGEGKWYAVRERQVRRSTDGITWDTVFGDSFTRMTALSADAGWITMAGVEGLIFDAPLAGLTTTNNWTQRSGASPVDANYYDFLHLVARGNTVVATGTGGLNMLSRDGGLTWQRGANGDFDGYYDLSEGAGRFVRTSRGGIQSSADGLTWETANVRDTRALAFGNGHFVAARDAGGFMVSTDGRVWTPAGAGLPWITALAYGNGRFLGRETNNGNLHTSVDGLTWTRAGQVAFYGVFSFAHDRFFALSSTLPAELSSSPDGVTWQPVAGLPAGSYTRVIRHRDRYLVIGDPTLASTDLINWTTIPVPAGAVAAVSLPDKLLIAGAGQALLYAPDAAPAPPPAAPVLTLNGNPAPNVFLFTLSGRAGQIVILERSANMQIWTAVDTFTLSGGAEALEVEDPQARATDYFRLRWTP
jgi:hypothetical protein